MKRVIAHLKGGLGNQMFIYAAARSLAIDSDARLQLRLDKFLNDGFGREYSLGYFRCRADLLPERSFYWRKMCTFVREQMKKYHIQRIGGTVVLPNNMAHKYVELNFGDSSKVSLEGFFQSEKYFYRNRREIVSDFRLSDAAWLVKDPMFHRISKDQSSTFLHVRSYKDIKGHSDGSASLPLEYYAAAINILSRRIKRGNIYCFSDDLEWAIDRLSNTVKRAGFVLVPISPSTQVAGIQREYSFLRDFELMGICKNGIVADSTFSWWSGWLGEQEHACGIRLRPRKPGANDMDDMWPDRWIPVEYVI